MVGKKTEWQSFTPHTNNPSLLRKYMYACEQFLISFTEEQEKTYTYTPLPIVKMKIEDREKSIGIVEEKLHYIDSIACYVCGKLQECKEENIISANPFTRAQFMIICKECNTL